MEPADDDDDGVALPLVSHSDACLYIGHLINYFEQKDCHGFDGSGSGLRVFDSVIAQARSLNSQYPDYVLLRI